MEIYHMSGAGNDFVVLDVRGQQPDLSAMALRLCALTGADGLLALDHSQHADFRLHFYNSDGTRGEMCGNGARCICKFAISLGVAGESMSIQTDAGTVYGWHLGGDQYRVQLNNPSVADLHCHPDAAYIELGDPGIPHSVTEYPPLAWEDRDALLPKFLEIRGYNGFPKDVNVNLFRFLSPGRVRMLTHERGVEDFTLACGTGSASVAVYLWLQGRLPGGTLIAENPGGELTIRIESQDGRIHKLFLEGPATVLKTFRYDPCSA